MLAISIAGFSAVAAFSAWRAIKNWRQFRSGRRQPILAGVTGQQLISIPTEWPLAARRWPPPNPEDGPPLEAAIADAYARIAARARMFCTFTAEVIAVVGGALLGLALTNIWADYRVSAARVTTSGDTAPNWPVFTLAEMADYLPVVLIIIGVGIRFRARQYGQAQECYEAAAAKAPDEPNTPSDKWYLRMASSAFSGAYFPSFGILG